MTTSLQTSPFSWPRRLTIVASLIAGCVFTLRAMTPSVIATPTVAASAPKIASPPSASFGSPVQLVTKNIEDIQLGQRVVGRNPLRHETQSPSEINPATWRAVRLSMIQNLLWPVS